MTDRPTYEETRTSRSWDNAPEVRAKPKPAAEETVDVERAALAAAARADAAEAELAEIRGEYVAAAEQGLDEIAYGDAAEFVSAGPGVYTKAYDTLVRAAGDPDDYRADSFIENVSEYDEDAAADLLARRSEYQAAQLRAEAEAETKAIYGGFQNAVGAFVAEHPELQDPSAQAALPLIGQAAMAAAREDPSILSDPSRLRAALDEAHTDLFREGVGVMTAQEIHDFKAEILAEGNKHVRPYNPNDPYVHKPAPPAVATLEEGRARMPLTPKQQAEAARARATAEKASMQAVIDNDRANREELAAMSAQSQRRAAESEVLARISRGRR